MKCSDPFVMHGQAHACMRCLACTINRRRIWAHRIMLEAKCHSHNTFLTLTYSDDKLPKTNRGNAWTLKPRDLQLFVKRLRTRLVRLAPENQLKSTFRYFAVGEYGEKNSKPHYHLAIFGASSCSYGQSRYSKIYDTCCWFCELCRETWGHGHIFNAELNDVTAGYICGYVTKKMTAKDDVRLEPGQHPEFGRMSNRPGIGAYFMDEVASVLLEHDDVESEEYDVPGALGHGKNKYRPLGRYLRQQLRAKVGRSKAVPLAVQEKMRNEMSPLRVFAFNNSRSLKGVVKEVFAPATQALQLKFNNQTKREKL